jgi:hypothetical protein
MSNSGALSKCLPSGASKAAAMGMVMDGLMLAAAR